MKKLLLVLTVLLALMVLGSCVSEPKPDSGALKPVDTIMPPDVLEHKGTALGAPVPQWVLAYIEGGAQAVEKMPEYKGRYVVILESEGASRQGAQLAMDSMDITSQTARYFNTRVEQKFAGAQVGDRDKLEEYFENVVKVMSVARYTGMEPGPDYWVYLQYYKIGAKSKADVERRVYRVIRLYSIDDELLAKQLNKYLDDAEAATAKTPEEQRAIDLVQSSFYEDF
ncbi:MAG TPA: hypothetical protein PLC54_00855 [Spirochaetales bacterium]|nr:hypothetical protein [Spirochaetales bacterium]